MPHLLELFSGTGSIGRVFEEAGWRVTKVDIRADFEPTICKSVLELEPEDIYGETVDLVWGSPPCTHYSVARTKAKTPRDLEGSDALVAAVLKSASYYNAPYFFENPYGLLRTRHVVEGIPMHIIDYCKYNDGDLKHGGRKRTCVWTNTNWRPSRPLCKKDCRFCVNGKHVDIAQRQLHTLEELYAIPKALPEELVEWWENKETWDSR